ncbi:helix-turn-helix domain-containing protein [Delftia tsuruhatensis]
MSGPHAFRHKPDVRHAQKWTPRHAQDQDAMADKNFVSSLDKGLQVLGCFGRQHARLTVSEAARLTGSTPASARRSLLTLQALGYLDSDGKRFWMLPKALLIAHAYQFPPDAAACAAAAGRSL